MEQVPVEAGPPLGPGPSPNAAPGRRARSVSWRAAAVAVSLGAIALAAVMDRAAPYPSAEVSRGSEAAFVTGLEPREIEGGVVRRRWAGATLLAEFVHLPAGPLELQVVVRGHQHPVTIVAAGAVVGVIPEERSRGTYSIPEARGGRLSVTLQTEPFVAGDGRSLGFMLERLTLAYPRPAGLARVSLFLVFLVPAWATLFASRLAASSALRGSLLALASALAQALALWPQGLVRSTYSVTLAGVLAMGVLASALWARRSGRDRTREGDDTGLVLAALLLALWVQGLAATHPGLVTSDAVFHAHKVKAVAGGELFPVSITPHDPPYKFPYGVTFHLLVATLLRTGIDAEAGVRLLAAAASVLASAVLLRTLLPWGAVRAPLCVALLQLLPTTFGPFSAGNFSNVFAQAITVLFVCWVIGPHRGSWPLGAALVALAATAHFGALLVLLVLGPLLVLASRRSRDVPVLLALAAGLGLAGLYYLHFLPLMMSQLARVLEGGRGDGPGMMAAAQDQLRGLLREWGWPAVVAALMGAATMRRRAVCLPPVLWALWASGAVLAVVAIASPLEVRYLYALAPAVALLAADGLGWLREQPGGRVWTAILVLGQAWLAARGIQQAVMFAYRPPL
ncbi:MAG TPA: hypothetical protein VMV21_06410 [Vicinamibacteria bacterium]|nr:hypothetical protein [Vicinamibacteria bacterium]